jgi:hypothetical protein
MCRKEYNRNWHHEWRKNNLEKARKRGREAEAKRRAAGLVKPNNPETAKAWRAKNKDKLNARRRERRAENPDQQRGEISRVRATLEGTLKLLCRKPDRKNISKQLLLEKYHMQQGCCAISGVPMTWGRSGEGRIPTHISIDRIDNAKGYTLDNVQLVCFIVNRMKSDMLQDDLFNWCRAIVARNLS